MVKLYENLTSAYRVKLQRRGYTALGSETFPTTVTTQTRKPFQYNSWCKVLRCLAFINPFSMDLPERLDNHGLANAVETAFFPGDTEDWDR